MRARIAHLSVAATLVVTLAWHAPPAMAASATYYLSLGDSLAYGLQVPQLVAELQAGTFDPASFNRGYTNHVAARLASFAGGLQVVNYGCPGTSPEVFLYARCGFGLPLHDAFQGTQLQATLAFLRAHAGQVLLVTLDFDLGGRAVAELVWACQFVASCVAAGMPFALSYIRVQLDQVFQALVAAAAPSTRFVVNTAFNPYAPVLPWTNDVVAQQLNSMLTASAASYLVGVADMFARFNLAGDETRTLCSLTFVCTAPYYDVHPTDAGYMAMADEIWNAAGFPSAIAATRS